MSHKIMVRCMPDGKTEVRVEGLPGVSCKDATKAVEKALGMVTDDKKTHEYNQAAKTSASISQGHS